MTVVVFKSVNASCGGLGLADKVVAGPGLTRIHYNMYSVSLPDICMELDLPML